MASTVKPARIDLQLKRFFTPGFALAAALLSVTACPGLAHAQAQGETTPAETIGTASLLTPSQVDSYYGTSTTSTNGLGFTSRPPEVVELARALAGNTSAVDPANPSDQAKTVDRIYQYVLNNIEVVWLYGLQKGSVGAIVDHSGTAFDQAMLMVELLRQDGYTANYQVGQITLNGTQFYNWSGVQNAQAACQLLSNGSIGGVINGTTDPTCASYAGTNVSTITLNHVWVSVVISGTTYLFDPAFKTHTHAPGAGLTSVAALTTGQALTQATTNMTSATDAATGLPYVQRLNEAALDSTIQGYATNVLTYIKANPQAQMVDILGGEVIARYEVPAGGLRQASLSYVNASPAVRTWTGSVPDQYRTTLGVQQNLTHNNTGGSGFGTQQLWNVTLFVDEIYGRKLETFSNFNSTDGDDGGTAFTAYLDVLDETGAGVGGAPATAACFTSVANTPNCAILSGASYMLGDRSGTVTLSVNHPYAASANGTATTNGDYMDAVITKGVDLDVPFMIVHAWGDANGLDKQFGTRDDTVLPAPDVPTGDSGKQLGAPVGADAGDAKRESMSASWIVQSSKAARIQAVLATSIYQLHHSVGVVSADTLVTAVDYYPGVATPPGFVNNVPTVADSFTRFDIDSAFSLTSKVADPIGRRAAVLAIAASTDALEGSMAAQNSDLPDTTSTATRFEWGNAPPSGEDEFSQGPRRFFTFNSTNTTAQMQGVEKIAGYPRGTYSSGAGPDNCSGIYAGSAQPVLCNSTAAGWPDLLTTAASAYTQAGFSVTASEELRLGPGQPFGYADTFMEGQATEYTAFSTMQRGSAFVAVRYNTNGDPVQIAHVVVNTTPYGPGAGTISKGGGGGIQPDQQALWDPAKAADALKAKFVDRSTELGVDLSNGNVSYSVPAQLSIGNGDFPKKLTAQFIWRGGDGGAAQNPANALSFKPTDPDVPWTTNWHNMLAVGGSGLEAMGQSDPRAAAGTIGAFLAMQDIYKSAPSTQRDVAAVLVNSWWVKQLTGNAITVTIGASAKQFLKLVDGTFITPGDYAVLVQTNNRVINTSPCGLRPSVYPLTRGWDYSGATNNQPVSFTVTGAHGDVQHFPYWKNQVMDGKTCTLINGFRLTSWTFPQGVAVNVNYGPNSGLFTGADTILSVSNSLGRQINFVNLGAPDLTYPTYPAGFNNNLTGADARSVSASTINVTNSGSAAAAFTFTDPAGAATTVEAILTPWANSISRSLLHLVYTADNPAQGLTISNGVPTNPASLQYDYDTLRRVMDAKDGDALQLASHNPYYFYVGDHVRGEREDPLGASYAVEYDIYKQPLEYFDELGRETVLSHDARARVLSYTYPEGNQEQYVYDDRDNTLSLTEIAVPGSGQANLVTGATWDPTWNKPLTITDPNGNTTTFTYYAAGTTGASLMQNATRPADVNGNHPVYSFTYNSIGEPLTAADPTGVVTQNTYDSYGNLLTSAVDPAHINSVTQFSYGANGQVITTTDPLSNVTNFTYDPDGRKVFDIAPDPDGAGPLLRTATRQVYDAAGRLTELDKGETASATGIGFTIRMATTYVYDPANNKIQETLPAVGGVATGVTQYAYDGDNRLICTAVRMNPAIFTSLPASACALGTTGTQGPDRISQTNYDAAGQVVSQVRALGTSAQITYGTFAYGPDGEQIQVADANCNATTMVYDGFIRLIQQNYPQASRSVCPALNPPNPKTPDHEAYSYDSNGNRLSRATRKGDVITYAYDRLNRMVQKASTVAGVVPAVSYGYDLAGRPTSALFVATGLGVVMGYDTAGRLTSEATNGRVLTYAYDLAGNRTGLSWPDGLSAGYSYDPMNRLTGISENGATALIAVAYNAEGLRSVITRPPSGARTQYVYDAADRLTGLANFLASGSNNDVLSITYNAARQRVGKTLSNSNWLWAPPRAAVNNRTADGLNRDAAVAAASGGYDANANQTLDTVGMRHFSFDAENRLISETGGPLSLSLSYDPLGRLTQTVSGGTTVTNFLYAGEALVAEYGAGAPGTVLRRYVHGDRTDEPLVWFEGADFSQPRYLHADEQGSISAWSTATAGLGGLQTYDPYGQPASWSGSRFAYTGQIMLPEAQLYHYKARAYDPQGARFLQTDPIGYTGDVNLYAYVHEDPVNKTDPTGECEPFCGAAIGAIVGAGLEVAKETLVEGRDFQHLDAGAIGREAVIGGIAGATGAGIGALAEKGAALVATKAAASVAGAAVKGGVTSGVSSALHGDKPGTIAVKATAGAAFGGLGKAAGNAVTSAVGAAPKAAPGQIVTWGASKAQTAVSQVAGTATSVAIGSGGKAATVAGCKEAGSCQ